MKEKVISGIAYLWAGLTGLVSGLSINEIGVIVSIVATIFTVLINWLYRYRTLKALQQYPEVKKIYEQTEED
ncbi:HP1 family phage holin [Photobacterium leiognathi subsp. mandapamensis]